MATHNHSAGGHHRRLRFYVIMTTVVVGVILVLLFVNNDDGKLNITNAVIGNSHNASTNGEEVVLADTVTTTPQRQGSKVIEFSFTTDQIPTIEKEATLSSVKILFTDISTVINVNNDRLELSDIEQVELTIERFTGDFSVDDEQFSLDGTAERIEVNGVALSSQKELAISFKDLAYHQLYVEDIALSTVEFAAGNGEFTAERLTYELNEDEAAFSKFSGGLQIDRIGVGTTTLEGFAQSATLDGNFFALSLQ